MWDPAEDLDQWLGRREETADVIRAWPAAALHAALDLPGSPPGEGDALPPLWSWLHFLAAHPRSALGRDGHLRKGAGLAPPAPLPRRMWAGGRLTYGRRLKIGARATRISTVAAIKRKEGRTGPLVFVTLRHEIHVGAGLAETEEQDLVFRRDPDPTAPAQEPPAAPTGAQWRRGWTTDPTLLFRYSALTFNGHRIHYDLDYCREVEGYAGLVVHGPLLATLMMALALEQGPEKRVKAFSFRAASPVLHTEAFEACGKPLPEENAAALWIQAPGPNGQPRLAMSGRVEYGR